jgi:hypothetical protein
MGWPLQEKDIKRYPHFDGTPPLEVLNRIASDSGEVATYCFWPFLHYEKSWIRFRGPADSQRAPKKKTRPIRYAARQDSAIFSRYRALLSEQFEKLLADSGLSNSVLAYRRIPKSGGLGGKTNIDFARETFQAIRAMGTCCAVALDVQGYFDNIDHDLLKKQWGRLIGVNRLPPDHFSVFNAVTRFSWIDRDKLYERLGYLAMEPTRNGGIRKRSLVSRSEVPRQLCSSQVFRDTVAKKSASGGSLICQNTKCFGIPQGAPISDVLANVYLIDFDTEMSAYARSVGGHYFRYSDDILILVPGGEVEGRAAADLATSAIRRHGPEIKIKEEKTEIISFVPNGAGGQVATNVLDPKRKDGLTYLGFRFDGAKPYLRDGTLSGVRRKMRATIRREAVSVVSRHPGKDNSFLEREILRGGITQRFRRVRDFDDQLSKRRWTFYTYVQRAAKVFGPKEGQTFFQQAKGQGEYMRRAVSEEVARALKVASGLS